MRIDWYGNVLYPHEICSANLRLLGGAVRNLKEQRLSSALRKLYQVDNNAYAFNFDEEVYRHFTDYVFHSTISDDDIRKKLTAYKLGLLKMTKLTKSVKTFVTETYNKYKAEGE